MASETLKSALNRANPNTLADVLAKIDLGTMLEPKTVTVAQSSASTIPLDPPALAVFAARVTGGAAAAGARMVSDAGATASATVATLSADGATLTFEAGVTGAVVSYMPRPAVALDTAWPSI
jgi:hypothetical protein